MVRHLHGRHGVQSKRTAPPPVLNAYGKLSQVGSKETGRPWHQPAAGHRIHCSGELAIGRVGLRLCRRTRAPTFGGTLDPKQIANGGHLAMLITPHPKKSVVRNMEDCLSVGASENDQTAPAGLGWKSRPGQRGPRQRRGGGPGSAPRCSPCRTPRPPPPGPAARPPPSAPPCSACRRGRGCPPPRCPLPGEALLSLQGCPQIRTDTPGF